MPSFKSPFAPSNPLLLDTRDGYNAWSEIYDIENNVLINLEEDHLLPKIKEVSFKKALDCGCGTGRLSFWLKGINESASVTAMDFSEGMLEKAKLKPKADSIQWIQTDLLEPFPVENCSFDLVVSALVIEHINDFNKFFANIRAAATPGAEIFITGLHPSISLLGISARFTDKASSRHILPRSYDHSISEIFNCATSNGLKTIEMNEYKVTEAFVERNEKARRYIDLPLLFIMHLQG